MSRGNTYHFSVETLTQILPDVPRRHLAVWKKARLAKRQRPVNEGLRTFFQIMHDVQRLRDCSPNLILGQLIQPLKHTLDLVVSENLPCVRPCPTLSHLE